MNRQERVCIREFVLQLALCVDGAAAPATRQASKHATDHMMARLTRAFHRLPIDVQSAMTPGYRQLMTAHHAGAMHRVQAARHELLAIVIGNTGLTHEQLLAPPCPSPPVRSPAAEDGTEDIADWLNEMTINAETGRGLADDRDHRPVATAVPLPRDVGRTWSAHRPRVRMSRQRLFHRSLAALGAIAVAVCVAWFAWPRSVEPADDPADPSRTMFHVDRVVEFEGGAVIISHGENDGDVTRRG